MAYAPIANAVVTRWFLVFGERVMDESPSFNTREGALKRVASLNEEKPGHSVVRVPSRVVACEGCESHLLDALYGCQATHLTHIEWENCEFHRNDWGRNEQSSLIESWL